jgi:hypothetical protein
VTDQPLISEERIRRALEELGIHDIHSAHPDRPVHRDTLAGALLALSDLAARRAESDRLGEGYRWALRLIGGLDEAEAARWWARLMVDRLYLLADGLLESGTTGGELPLAEVAGPAAMAAANLLALLHHTAPDPGLVSQAVSGADRNLRHAVAGLAALRAMLARDGYDL